MGDLIPGEKLIYERVDDIVYARYANRPEIPRWIIGGKPKEGPLYDRQEWLEMIDAAQRVPTLRKALDKVITIWYTIKDDERSK